MSTVDAVGERSVWEDDSFDRARRELSVIDERDVSPERPLSPKSKLADDDNEDGEAEDAVTPTVIVDDPSEFNTEDTTSKDADGKHSDDEDARSSCEETPEEDGDNDTTTVNDDHWTESSDPPKLDATPHVPVTA